MASLRYLLLCGSILLPTAAFGSLAEQARSAAELIAGHPRPDDWVQFVQANAEAVASATPEELMEALRCFTRPSEAMASQEDLLSFAESNRAALESLECRYNLKLTDASGTSETTCLFARESASGRCRFQRNSVSGAAVKPDTDVSFDGEIVRAYQQTQTDAYAASIVASLPPTAFVDLDYNIMVAAMQADLGELLQLTSPQFDIVEFLKQDNLFIFGGMDEIGGHDCVCVSTLDTDIWFCPDYGFSVVRLIEFDASETSRTRVREVQMSEFNEYDSGVFFPSKIDMARSEPESDAQTTATFTVTSLSINEKISDELFTSVFPPNALVRDRIEGLSYLAGQDGSISEVVDLNVLAARNGRPISQEGRSSTFWMLMAFNVVAVVSLLGYLVYVRKLRSRP